MFSISWMQKNKKYLIVTIWISVIAFVGAGFVGWGSYNFAHLGGSVATVGDYEISFGELNDEYSNLYSQMTQRDPDFDQAKARAMGLEASALNNLVNQKYILNYANDLGLIVTSKELVKAIANNQAFMVDGRFSKATYKQILSSNGIKPSDYEEGLKRQLLITKVLGFFDFVLMPVEQELADLDTYLEDEVVISVLDSADYNIKPTEQEIKAFWEEKKGDYLTQQQYVLEVVKTPINTDMPLSDKVIEEYYNANKSTFTNDSGDNTGEIKPLQEVKKEVIEQIAAQKALEEANRAYYDLKNDHIKNTELITLDRNSDGVTTEIYQTISTTGIGEYIKPMQLGNSYIASMLKEIKAPRQKSYEEAKEQAEFYLIFKLKQDRLKKEAQEQLKDFSGESVGFISKKNYIEQLTPFGLDQFEANNFVFRLLDSTSKKGYFVIDQKVVIYEILDQRISPKALSAGQLSSLEDLNTLSQGDDSFYNTKNALIQNALVDRLKKKYEVSISYTPDQERDGVY